MNHQSNYNNYNNQQARKRQADHDFPRNDNHKFQRNKQHGNFRNNYNKQHVNLRSAFYKKSFVEDPWAALENQDPILQVPTQTIPYSRGDVQTQSSDIIEKTSITNVVIPPNHE
jgi:hypothetical protein